MRFCHLVTWVAALPDNLRALWGEEDMLKQLELMRGVGRDLLQHSSRRGLAALTGLTHYCFC